MTEWKDEAGEPQYEQRYEDPKSGTGKVMAYFFGAVMLCAVSLAMGYMMGKRAGTSAAVPAPAPTQAAPASGAAKPGASRAAEVLPAESTSPPAEAMPAPATSAPKAAAAKPAKAPEMAAAPKGIMVQVAAVTRQEDAETLASALRKKKYPVFVMPPAGADKFYHVQVGPFAELRDADAMKAKLAGDGYNAIVKK